MTTVFEGPGAFLLNHFAQKPQSPKIKRMSRHPKALEEPEPFRSLAASIRCVGTVPMDQNTLNQFCSGPEFDFTWDVPNMESSENDNAHQNNL